MNVSLVVVSPDGKQSEVVLKRSPLVVGRQTDCQVRIPSSSISRHHCEFTVGEGKVSVRDLGSSNGTFVNQRRVTQADLSPGDLVAVGDLVLVVRVDGRPQAIDADDVLEDGQVAVAGRGPSSPAPSASPSAPTRVGQASPAPAAPGKRITNPNDSSVDDFDFLDEDDDIKKQPKL